MLLKTRGIVLNFIRYKETSIIVKIYTEELGLQSFVVNGVRSKRSKNKTGLYQPLSLVDLVIYHKESRNLHRISEIRSRHPFRSIPFDIKKSTVALFLTEVLLKSVREETADTLLFNFLEEKIVLFDKHEAHADFHLRFLAELTAFLGFQPLSPEHLAGHSPELDPTEDDLQQIENLFSKDYLPARNKKTRRRMLDFMLNFYGYNIESVRNLKSLPILTEVLS